MASREELAKFTVVQLRHQLKAKKMSVSGLKTALIDRLMEEEKLSAPRTKRHLETMAAPQAKPVHISRECPQADGGGEGGNSDNFCANCNEQGHFSRECPQRGDGGDGEDGDSDNVCSNCFGSGHSAHHCPFAGGGGGYGGSHSGNVCSNCNEPGCISRECLQGRGGGARGVQNKGRSSPNRGRTQLSRATSKQQSASALPRTTTTTSTVAAVVVPPPSTTTAASADATVPTSSSSTTTTASSKKALKRQRNHNNKKKGKLLVVVPKGMTPSHVTHDPGLPEDTFEVSRVLASSAYNGERLYYLEWKHFRGRDSWVRTSWSDSLEITASFVEDSKMDSVLQALTGKAVAQHLLLKLEKRPLYRQLIVKPGTGPVLSTDMLSAQKQRTNNAQRRLPP